MRFKILILLFAIILTSCKSFLEKTYEWTSKSFEIRVLLKSAKDSIVLTNKNGFIVRDSITKKKLNLQKNTTLTICIKNNKIFINELNISSPINIYSKDNSLIKLNDRYYFGYLKIIPDRENFYVINYISIETYLMSVLPSEIPTNFELEAMKAQSIVARTYSYYFMQKYNDRYFDVDDTTGYQVYNGFNPDYKIENIKKIYKAIKETEGLIIKYNEEPIIAYFHANSGGWTTSGKEYFGENSNFPYLVSKQDPYSVDMPGYKWEFEITIKEFCEKFNIDNTVDIKLENFIHNEKGFIEQFKNNKISINSKEIRKAIGYSKLKSEKFNISIKEDKLYFTGYGYGHGVGMSQWGAENMARKKKKFKEIINFYYPETKIESF